jgi:hypothetical protein
MADKKNGQSSHGEVKQKNKTYIHPEATNAYFCNFFAVEVSEDDIALSFGQRLPLEEEGKKTFEVRRRMIMTYKGAKILSDLLKKTVENIEISRKK